VGDHAEKNVRCCPEISGTVFIEFERRCRDIGTKILKLYEDVLDEMRNEI